MTLDTKAIRAAAEFTKNNTAGLLSVVETDTLIALLDRLEAAEKDAARLDWLLTYFVSDDTSKDDEIIAASDIGVDQIKSVIDTAMKEQK